MRGGRRLCRKTRHQRRYRKRRTIPVSLCSQRGVFSDCRCCHFPPYRRPLWIIGYILLRKRPSGSWRFRLLTGENGKMCPDNPGYEFRSGGAAEKFSFNRIVFHFRLFMFCLQQVMMPSVRMLLLQYTAGKGAV